jgi:hypothetical protein
LLAIKANAGNAVTILTSRYPLIFRGWMYFFVLIHLVYMPVYMSVKTGSEWHMAVFAGMGIIIGFIYLVETHFANPFKYNSFRMQEIIPTTFSAVDSLLEFDKKVSR